jgi:hypothetical protein
MQESAPCRKNDLPKSSLIGAIYEKRVAECAFLSACCESGSLIPVQKAAILGLIDRLVEEEKILEWMMGPVKPANRGSIYPPAR